jgi:protein TonB
MNMRQKAGMNCGLMVWTILAIFSTIASAQDLKKLTRVEAMNAAVTKIQPEYPTLAKQLKVQGSVELEAVVAENGTVEAVNIVSGNPVLTKPASEALKHWKFTPFQVEGKPAKALVPVSIIFKL